MMECFAARRRIWRPCVTALAALALLGLTPAGAGAVLVSLKTFPVSVDVDLEITEKTAWTGIRPGCYAPAENFSMTYKLDMRTRPNGPKSKIKRGTATLTGASYGTTETFGAKGGFRQLGSPGSWELETKDPPGCDSGAPPPPAWAVSPTCKRISERVSTALLANDIDDPDDPTSNRVSSDGVLAIARTPKPVPTAGGATMGASCYRTLHDITREGLSSAIAIAPTSTFIMVPIPKLELKLAALARGSSHARPSFRVDITVGGDCAGMRMKPSLGPDPDFTKAPFSQAHDALGSFNGEADRTLCTISGSGRVIVRREGAVVNTGVVLRTR